MKQKIIAVTGPTASGKTALAVRIAESVGGEVISGDSMQIYRGMDIGTAKPTADEMRGIPHHLIDIVDINVRFSAAEFISMAEEKISEVASRGKTPIIAGGTGMYINMLLSGRFFGGPDSDPQLRESLFARAEAEGPEALHAYLAMLDPQAAADIHYGNVRRVVRAIEIALTTGKTKSQHLHEAMDADSRYDCLHLHLTSDDRQLLYSRCDKRVDEMLSRGLEDEVRRLYGMGLKDAPTASAAIGYKEFFPFFEGECGRDAAIEKIKQHTRNYVKRQMTYFAKIDGRLCLDIGAQSREQTEKDALDAVRKHYEKI